MPDTSPAQMPPQKINDIRAIPNSTHPPQSTPERVGTKKRFVAARYIAILVIACTIVGVAVFAATKQDGTDSTNVAVIQNRVGKHMLLPQDEQPTLATVTDSSKLTTPFLRQSQNGDKILIYQKAKKVIIYRPSIDRIIDTGPLSMSSP